MSTEYVSQREFARRVGVSHVWINRQVQAGNIPHQAGRGIPYEAGLEAYNAAQDVRYGGSRAYHAEQREKRKSGLGQESQSLSGDEDSIGSMTGGNSARVNAKLNQARMVKTTYEAKTKQLEYERLAGRLIPVEDVRADAARIGIIVQQRLLTLGGRVANRCEGMNAAQIEDTIRHEVNTIIEELHRSAFAEGGDD